MSAPRHRTPTLAKLCPPRLQAPLARARLTALFEDEARSAFWLAGPPGAGKTTLVAGWLAAQRKPVAWFQVEPGDAEPGHCFRYLRELALSHSAKAAALPMFDPAQRGDFAAFARQFLRGFYACLSRDSRLVFDNTQEADGEFFTQLLALLVEELPPHCQLFVLSHRAPGDSLAQAVAHRRLQVLDWTQLKFDEAESRALLASLRGHDRDAQALHGLARGWAAGLVLLSAQGEEDWRLLAEGSGDPQQVFGYFAATVFERLSAGERHTLSACALMPRFTAAMATLVSEELAAEQMLEDIARRGLFVEKRRAADGQAWYQFHPLFRAFLRQRLAQLQAAVLNPLKARAARVLDHAGDSESAVRLLLEMGDRQAAGERVLAHASQWLREGRRSTLVELAEAIHDAPPAMQGWLIFWASMARVHEDEAKSRARFEAAHAAFVEQGDSVGQRLAAAALIEAVTAGWSNFVDLERWAAILHDPALADRPITDPDLEIIFVTGMLACGIVFSGDSDALREAARRGLALVHGDGDVSERLALATLLVNYFDNYGPEPAVQQALNAGEALLGRPGVTDFRKATWFYWLACYHLQLASLHGRISALKPAEAAIAEAGRLARAGGFESILFGEEWVTADIAMNRREFDKAEQKMRDAARWLHASRPIDTLQFQFKRAHLALRRGDAAAALVHLDAGIAQAVSANIPNQLIWSPRWLRSVMLVRLGRVAEAIDAGSAAVVHANTIHKPRCELALEGYRALLHFERGERAAGQAALRRCLAGMREANTFAVMSLLSPELAKLCAEALAADIESGFVVSLVRSRALAAPANAPAQWPWPLRIVCFGGFRLEVDGAPLELSRKAPKKPLELIKALAAAGSLAFKGIAVTRLMDDLWPDPETEDAQGNFDITLHRARKLIGHEDALLLRGGDLVLNAELVWSDCAALEQSLNHLQNSQGDQTDAANVSRLLALYSGSLLPGEPAGWALRQREHWNARFIDAVLKVGAALEETGQLEAAVSLYERGLAQDNLVEAFYRGLMRCHLARRDSAEAMRAYRRCRELLSIVLGIAPSAETERLREQALG